MTKPRITIGTRDVTEEIGAMYDAIIGSTDWGSEFLDADQVRAILIVGTLAGFEVTPVSCCKPIITASKQLWHPRHEEYKAALAKWRAQMQAEIDALAKERDGEV